MPAIIKLGERTSSTTWEVEGATLDLRPRTGTSAVIELGAEFAARFGGRRADFYDEAERLIEQAKAEIVADGHEWPDLFVLEQHALLQMEAHQSRWDRFSIPGEGVMPGDFFHEKYIREASWCASHYGSPTDDIRRKRAAKGSMWLRLYQAWAARWGLDPNN
jgi:hypothetical protein